MLTQINLDDETFEELAEEAKNMAASIYPAWTDFNYHDPGITLIELFSWLQEIACYKMNYIGEAHLKKYLKLMGIPRKPLTPAKVMAAVDCKKSLQLPSITRFFASGVCFENMRSKYFTAGDIQGCVYPGDDGKVFVRRLHMGFKIPPFGRQPQEGSCFEMCFKEPLPVERALSVYVDVYNSYSVRRNPVNGWKDFMPISVIAMDYLCDDGWENCEYFSDGTSGLLESGWLEFSVNKPMVAGENGLYMLRLRIVSAAYDVYPMVTNVRMNCLMLCQTRHYAVCLDLECRKVNDRAECRVEANEVTLGNISVLVPEDGPQTQAYYIFENYTVRREDEWIVISLGETDKGMLPEKVRVMAWEILFETSQSPGVGDGLPFQVFELEGAVPEAESFILMIEDEENEGRLVQWQRVEDFSASGPEDYHYVLDTQKKQLVFGDCFHGMAPKGQLFIGQYAACEGIRGNIKARSAIFPEEGYEDLLVTNEEGAAGGCDEESFEDCFMDARAAMRKNGALVTDGDYEEAVKTTPGLMIENCKVIDGRSGSGYGVEDDGKLRIVVKPFSLNKNPKLSELYKKNIFQWLESRRMIGTNIVLMSPEYLKLNVFIECKGQNNYVLDRKMIVHALDNYFKPFSTVFGKIISQSEVYEILDRLEAVAYMESLSIDIEGNHIERNHGGEIILPQNGLISAEDIHYIININ